MAPPDHHHPEANHSPIEPASDPEHQQRPNNVDRAPRSTGRHHSQQSTPFGVVAQTPLATGLQQDREPASTNQSMTIEVTVHFESLTTGFARKWRSVIQTWHSAENFTTTDTEVQELVYAKLDHAHQNNVRSQFRWTIFLEVDGDLQQLDEGGALADYPGAEIGQMEAVVKVQASLVDPDGLVLDARPKKAARTTKTAAAASRAGSLAGKGARKTASSFPSMGP